MCVSSSQRWRWCENIFPPFSKIYPTVVRREKAVVLKRICMSPSSPLSSLPWDSVGSVKEGKTWLIWYRAPLMTRSLLPIQKDLISLHQTLQTHQSRKQSCHVLDQARYMLHYHDQLSAFKESIPRHRESICFLRDIVEGDIDDQADNSFPDEERNVERRERRDSVMKLAGIVEREEAKQEDDAYNQQWLAESSRLRHNIETVMEEGLDDEPDNNCTLSSSPSKSNLVSSLAPGANKSSFTPFSTFSKAASLGSKPTFKLDIFETFSCTNMSQSSPPLDMACLDPWPLYPHHEKRRKTRLWENKSMSILVRGLRTL